MNAALDWNKAPKPAPPPRTVPVCELRGDAARQVLRGLNAAGLEIVKRARSPHGSDCGDCPDGDDLKRPAVKENPRQGRLFEHARHPIGHCRCVRVMRLRVHNGGDWLLVWGDRCESQAFKLHGPYAPETPLTYGGGFWARVEV